MDKSRALIERRLRESNEVRALVFERCADDITRAAEVIAQAFHDGNKLMLCGNGGSAADCQHMAAEFVSRLSKNFERRALPAIALTTDTSFITAYTNDYSYEGVFARQIEALAQRGDVVLGISTSGSSGNIVRALVEAQRRGCITVALIGEGGRLREISDVCISIPSGHTQYIQECHLSIEHIVCELVENLLFKRPNIANNKPVSTSSDSVETVTHVEKSGELL
jgi:phosphoheptose isomerase